MSPVIRDTRLSAIAGGWVTSIRVSLLIGWSRSSLPFKVPRSSSARASRDPRNPAPPVTITFIDGRSYCYSIHCLPRDTPINSSGGRWHLFQGHLAASPLPDPLLRRRVPRPCERRV